MRVYAYVGGSNKLRVYCWQELTNERNGLQDKVTKLENDVVAKDQQLQEYQQRIEELLQQHEAAVDEGKTLRQQMESLNK